MGERCEGGGGGVGGCGGGVEGLGGVVVCCVGLCDVFLSIIASNINDMSMSGIKRSIDLVCIKN